MVVILIFVFVVSLSLGSFLNVVVDRVIRSEQFWKGRSYCESCKHKLNTKDLIPLISFISQRGKCRYCKSKIPIIHPIFELSTAIFITSIVYYAGYYQELSWFFLLYSVLLGILLLLIFFSDLVYYVIPDTYLYLLAGMYVFFGVLQYFFPGVALTFFYTPLLQHIYGGVIMALFFAFLHYGSHGKAMGSGDIFLAGFLGLFLGLELSIVMWSVSFLTGAVIGVILILTGRRRMGQVIPFGPFLVLGAVTAYLFGFSLINWYLRLL